MVTSAEVLVQGYELNVGGITQSFLQETLNSKMAAMERRSPVVDGCWRQRGWMNKAMSEMGKSITQSLLQKTLNF